MTREAARALGLDGEAGTLQVGKRGDLALWDTGEPAALVANLGSRPKVRRFVGGKPAETD